MFVLPVLTLLAAEVAQTTRMIRATMIDVLDFGLCDDGAAEGRAGDHGAAASRAAQRAGPDPAGACLQRCLADRRRGGGGDTCFSFRA